MLREVLCITAGLLIHAANVSDIVWTALGTHGGGPISGKLCARLWQGALALHKRRPHHRLLSFVGSVMIVFVLALWISLVWLGWFAIFSAKRNAVLNAQTHQAAPIAARAYFTAYTISTLGNGDYVPNGPAWQIVTAIATIGGVGALTMTITFLMNILPAVVQQRTLAAYLSDLGGTPGKILARSWTGEQFDGLNDHFIALTGMIHLYTEQHLAYPVLHFFHSEKERTASSLRLAALYETIVLLNRGVAGEARLSPMVILPLRDAMRGLREIIAGEFVKPPDTAPDPPPLSVLRELGIPTVSEDEWREAMAATDDSRRFFAGLVRDDGWPWERVSEPSPRRDTIAG